MGGFEVSYYLGYENAGTEMKIILQIKQALTKCVV